MENDADAVFYANIYKDNGSAPIVVLFQMQNLLRRRAKTKEIQVGKGKDTADGKPYQHVGSDFNGISVFS